MQGVVLHDLHVAEPQHAELAGIAITHAQIKLLAVILVAAEPQALAIVELVVLEYGFQSEIKHGQWSEIESHFHEILVDVGQIEASHEYIKIAGVHEA